MGEQKGGQEGRSREDVQQDQVGSTDKQRDTGGGGGGTGGGGVQACVKPGNGGKQCGSERSCGFRILVIYEFLDL